MSEPTGSLKGEIGKLRWRCRRGMRELDQVTEGFLNNHYADASADERAAYQRLLELPDPQLLALIYEHEPAEDSVTARVLAQMRNR